jgi:hypothetical protein
MASSAALPANRDPGVLGEGSVRRVVTAMAGALLLAATCFTVLGNDQTPAVLVGVNTDAKRSLPTMGLWEDDDDPHHDPYYNIFEDEETQIARKRSSHRDWNPEQVQMAEPNDDDNCCTRYTKRKSVTRAYGISSDNVATHVEAAHHLGMA